MNKTKVALGADHAGYELKEHLKDILNESSYETVDFGTNSDQSVDYPDYVHPLADSIEKGEQDIGILVCGSGNGVAMAANKHKNIRAALCWTNEVAELARKHNNANVLCLPSRQISKEDAEKILLAFLNTSFEGGRHVNRVQKISEC